MAHAETVVESTSLPFSSASLELLIAVVDTLLARAFSRSLMRGRYAGKAMLECALEAGPTWTMEFSFKGGVGSRKRALSIIRPRLEEEHPSAPVEDVSLTLDNLTGESGTQIGLLPEARKTSKLRLVEVDRDLRARTGGTPFLYRVVGVAPWHPATEMQTLRVPVDSSEGDNIRSLSSPFPDVVREDRERQPEAVRLGNRWREVSRIEVQWASPSLGTRVKSGVEEGVPKVASSPSPSPGFPTAGVVALEAQPHEQEAFGVAAPLVAEWRRLRAGRNLGTSQVERARAAVR